MGTFQKINTRCRNRKVDRGSQAFLAERRVFLKPNSSRNYAWDSSNVEIQDTYYYLISRYFDEIQLNRGDSFNSEFLFNF